MKMSPFLLYPGLPVRQLQVFPELLEPSLKIRDIGSLMFFASVSQRILRVLRTSDHRVTEKVFDDAIGSLDEDADLR